MIAVGDQRTTSLHSVVGEIPLHSVARISDSHELYRELRCRGRRTIPSEIAL
jgi:hypothetical protein